MSAFVLRAYSETYPDVAFDAYVGALWQPVVRDMANRCLARAQDAVSLGRSAAYRRDDLQLSSAGRCLRRTARAEHA